VKESHALHEHVRMEMVCSASIGDDVHCHFKF
jgi:hypothetical protein